ncbi:M20/M25/M40 family metallo-hydrolase [Homoserinibacter sp. YIM 151385]|uniref:M20/M25/M40 family metallo-hydrolase n=1 Tax=Homoserinibacter sp. YIM 151385 TaxID=2985506 RepID=UPI0022F0A570|nr:M20/M25/M40 family metallo-hydrolase [Homoserinibacter sp. YIM 151385]WBU38557.1 M20/M25/M40 family metallo-hydrolase [Homoserinibacter sp. YIM 151385]
MTTSAAADAPLEATAEIARDLIRIDTTNHGGGSSAGEREAAEYVEARLRGLGLEPQLFESAPRRTSVVARVEGRDRSRPALVVHGHLDVVPADPANWSVDPFGGEIRDGMLWGRGAVDMKDMDAMMLTALGDVLDGGGQPARDLVIAYFADEEAGGLYGASWMVDHHPEVFAGASEAISEVGGYSIDLQGTRAYLLQTGEKSLVWIKLIARGTAAHGSRVMRDNAITKLAEGVAALGRREWPIQLTTTTDALLDEIARITGADRTRIGPDQLVMSTGSASGFLLATLRATSNPTLLQAGYKHNVIPDRAEALIDIRTIPGDEARILAEVQELVGPEIEIEIVHQDVGLENPLGGELVDRMTAALGRHDPGAPVLPYLLSGGTDNKSLSRLGIAGYGFAPLRLGPGLDFPAMFHGVDERVPLDALAFGRRVLGDLLRDC